MQALFNYSLILLLCGLIALSFNKVSAITRDFKLNPSNSVDAKSKQVSMIGPF